MINEIHVAARLLTIKQAMLSHKMPVKFIAELDEVISEIAEDYNDRTDSDLILNATSMSENMTKALTGLKELISKKWDYCDALETMSKQYQVDENELDDIWMKY